MIEQLLLSIPTPTTLLNSLLTTPIITPTLSPPTQDQDETLALLLPLLILLTTLLFLLLVFLIFLIIVRRNRGIVLTEENGPINLEREDLIEGEGGLNGVEQRWLDGVEDSVKTGYLRGKVWSSQYPPNSQPTDITLSQFLSIQEKGVSAWSFEPDYESNPALIVQSRTEITFLSDGVGMAPEEGGGCCVQSNLPLPRLNEVYYWECKMYEKPEGTQVAIGLATKPFPSFRLPGWNKYSVGYFSSDGFKSHSYPFTAQSYGPPLTEGDVLGVGYRPRTGTVFFTRNGKKLEDAYIGLNRHNLFPTVGANSSCTVHVNLGQAGFVFIEANVKKWGLAPMLGTLAPPPAYGSERGSILLESARNGHNRRRDSSGELIPTATTTIVLPPPPPRSEPSTASTRPRQSSSSASTSSRHRNKRPPPPAASSSSSSSSSSASAAAVNALASPSQPIRPSPLRHSRHPSSDLSSPASPASSTASSSRNIDINRNEAEERNPPTPGPLDISLRSLHAFPNMELDEEEERRQEEEEAAVVVVEEGLREEEEEEREEEEGERERLIRRESASAQRRVVVEPPAYHPIDPHMYAPGVAEAVLEDAFAVPASRQFVPQLPSGMNIFNSPSSSSAAGLPFRSLNGTASPSSYEGRTTTGSGWLSWLGSRGVPVSSGELNQTSSSGGTTRNGSVVVDIFGNRRPGGTR